MRGITNIDFTGGGVQTTLLGSTTSSTTITADTSEYDFFYMTLGAGAVYTSGICPSSNINASAFLTRMYVSNIDVYGVYRFSTKELTASNSSYPAYLYGIKLN